MYCGVDEQLVSRDTGQKKKILKRGRCCLLPSPLWVVLLPPAPSVLRCCLAFPWCGAVLPFSDLKFKTALSQVKSKSGKVRKVERKVVFALACLLVVWVLHEVKWWLPLPSFLGWVAASLRFFYSLLLVPLLLLAHVVLLLSLASFGWCCRSPLKFYTGTMLLNLIKSN